MFSSILLKDIKFSSYDKEISFLFLFIFLILRSRLRKIQYQPLGFWTYYYCCVTVVLAEESTPVPPDVVISRAHAVLNSKAEDLLNKSILYHVS